MLKDLIAESTPQRAIEYIAQIRDNPERADENKLLEQIGSHIFASQDFRDLLMTYIQDELLKRISNPKVHIQSVRDTIAIPMLSGILIGFSYAEYLQEVKELNSLK